MTLGVRAIVERGDGRVFMLRHTYTPGWYLPGGGVERGETAELSLARELVEEAGVVLNAAALIDIFSNHKSFNNDHVLVYRVTDWTPCGATSRGEIADSGWFDPLDPPTDTTAGNARRLAEVYGGAAVSTYW